MRRRKRLTVEDDAEVAMSPLIDCVFLLLIFFLVTTMIKRKEAHIPNTLPDPTSSPSVEQRERVIVVALDEQGRYYCDRGHDKEGRLLYRQIDDLADYLKELVDSEGQSVLQRPLRIDLGRQVEAQAMIDAIDIAKLQGFENVGIKTRARKGH